MLCMLLLLRDGLEEETVGFQYECQKLDRLGGYLPRRNSPRCSAETCMKFAHKTSNEFQSTASLRASKSIMFNHSSSEMFPVPNT